MGKQHKHLRAQKVYAEDEYDDTYDEYTWYEEDWLDLPDKFIRAGGCEEGTCRQCDWQRQHDAATGWDDPNFIEAWDYTQDYWEEYVKKL